MFLLKEYIKTILLEKRRGASENENRLQDEIDTLKQYVDKGYFFHMTDDWKLSGVNFKTEYSTPLGIYFFPLDDDHFQQILVGTLDDRKYVTIYNLKGDIVKSSDYTWTDFKNDYSTLTGETIAKRASGQVDVEWLDEIKVDHPLSALLYLVYGGSFDSKSDAVRATKNLLQLGYNGIYDDLGLGVIHELEPIQAVVFSSRYCERLEVVHNPYVLNEKSVRRKIDYIIKRFDSMSEDEQIKSIKYIVHVNRLLFNNINNIKPKTQLFILDRYPNMVGFIHPLSNDMCHRLSGYKNYVLNQMFISKYPKEFLQYLLDTHNDLILQLSGNRMHQSIIAQMKQSGWQWDDDDMKWTR